MYTNALFLTLLVQKKSFIQKKKKFYPIPAEGKKFILLFRLKA